MTTPLPTAEILREYGPFDGIPQVHGVSYDGEHVWLAAGDKGKINVVWYETNKVVDLACEKADVYVKTATVIDADTSQPTLHTTDPIGRVVSPNSDICQSGTTCQATATDRRMASRFDASTTIRCTSLTTPGGSVTSQW